MQTFINTVKIQIQLQTPLTKSQKTSNSKQKTCNKNIYYEVFYINQYNFYKEYEKYLKIARINNYKLILFAISFFQKSQFLLKITQTLDSVKKSKSCNLEEIKNLSKKKS